MKGSRGLGFLKKGSLGFRVPFPSIGFRIPLKGSLGFRVPLRGPLRGFRVPLGAPLRGFRVPLRVRLGVAAGVAFWGSFEP